MLFMIQEDLHLLGGFLLRSAIATGVQCSIRFSIAKEVGSQCCDNDARP